MNLPDGTNLIEEVITATLISVGDNIRQTKKGTSYRYCKVALEYPDGETGIIDARLWEGSLAIHTDKFVPNATIGLAIQVEGEGAGFAKVELPPFAKVDLVKLGLVAQTTAPVAVTV